MDYRQSKEWLESLTVAMQGFNLETTRALCRLAGISPEKFRAVHVAGSNGKGSTCQFISTILIEAGYKTGFYSSPHLAEPTERIKLNGKDITENEFAGLADRAKGIIDANRIKANYFEAITLMAFMHFADEKIDYLVAEVGMGGRLDATNVLNGEVCAITSISLEHTQYLGSTIEKIAAEKAGIIKENSIVVIADSNAAKGAILAEAKRKKCKSFAVEWEETSSLPEGNEFSLKKPMRLSGLVTSMPGYYQIENAAVAAACAIALREKGAIIPENAIRSGLEKAVWPGRMQTVSREPRVLLDAGHNPDGWKKLFESLKILEYGELIIVFGVLSDKDTGTVMAELGKADTLIITRPDSARAEEPERLRRKIGFGMVEPSPEKAIGIALEKAGKNGLVLITGSIYLVGQAWKFFGKKS